MAFGNRDIDFLHVRHPAGSEQTLDPAQQAGFSNRNHHHATAAGQRFGFNCLTDSERNTEFFQTQPRAVVEHARTVAADGARGDFENPCIAWSPRVAPHAPGR